MSEAVAVKEKTEMEEADIDLSLAEKVIENTRIFQAT